MPSRRDATLVAVSGALCLLALLFAQLSGRVIAEESVHVPQILWFLQGRFEAHPRLTTIPGYHLAVAALLKVASIESLGRAHVLTPVTNTHLVCLILIVKNKHNT